MLHNLNVKEVALLKYQAYDVLFPQHNIDVIEAVLFQNTYIRISYITFELALLESDIQNGGVNPLYCTNLLYRF